MPIDLNGREDGMCQHEAQDEGPDIDLKTT